MNVEPPLPPSSAPEATRAEDPDANAPPGPTRPGLAGNATWRLAGTVFRVAAGVLSVPLYTRTLGMSQWGLLALFQAIIVPLSVLDLGFGAATLKYVAEANGRGDREEATRVVHTTLFFNVAIGLVGALAVLASSRWLATSIFEIPAADEGRAIIGFRVTAVSGLVGVITATYASVLSAHHRFGAVTRLTTLSVVGSVGSGLAVALAGGDAVHVLVAQMIASTAMLLLWFLAASSVLPGLRSLPRWDAAVFRRSFAFGAWEAVWIGGGMLTATAGRYVLGAFFAPAVVGMYSIVQLLSAQLVGAFGEMGEVLFPAVSQMEGEGRLVEARRLSLLVSWTLSTGFGIAAAVLAVAGGDFLHLWISPETARDATTTLRLLCVAGILGMCLTAPGAYVSGIGKSKWGAGVNSVLGLTVAGLSLLLVPRFGLAGAGWGMIAGFATEWVFLVLIWRSHFSAEYRFSEYAACVFAPALISLAVLLVATRLHDALALTPSWPKLVLEVLLWLLAVAAVQISAGELLPGGASRRRDVVSSVRPVLARIFGTFST